MKTLYIPSFSEAGNQSLKAVEVLKLRAYLCPSKKLTIGWGHVILAADFLYFKQFNLERLQFTKTECERRGTLTKEALSGLFINTTQAEELFKKDTQIVADAVAALTPVTLTQNQFDAVVRLVFNIGQANYATSTLRKKLKAGDFSGAASEFDRWIYGTVNGKKIKEPGLVARRAAERALFEAA